MNIEEAIRNLPPERLDALLAMPAVKARLGASCNLTERQREAEALLRSDTTHCMLFGGSRSGKTFLIIREIIARALTTQSRMRCCASASII